MRSELSSGAEMSGNGDSRIIAFATGEDFMRHRDYIHQNPVKRGLVVEARLSILFGVPGFQARRVNRSG